METKRNSMRTRRKEYQTYHPIPTDDAGIVDVAPTQASMRGTMSLQSLTRSAPGHEFCTSHGRSAAMATKLSFILLRIPRFTTEAPLSRVKEVVVEPPLPTRRRDTHVQLYTAQATRVDEKS